MSCITYGFVQCTMEQRPRTDCPLAVHWNRARSGSVTNRWLNSVTFADRPHLTSKQRNGRVMNGYWFHWRIRTYRQQWSLKILCLSSYTWYGRSAPSDGSVCDLTWPDLIACITPSRPFWDVVLWMHYHANSITECMLYSSTTYKLIVEKK